MPGKLQAKARGTADRNTAVRVVAFLIAVASPVAIAQDPRSHPRGPERSPECLPRATRVRESCDPKQVVAHDDKEVTFSLELPPLKNAQCAAAIEVAYTQRGSVAGVEGTIENKDCAASSGEYKLAVTIRDENLELKTLEFLESWQRQDDRPVEFSATYPIGENVDLVRVRPMQSRCTCADAPGE